MRKWRYEDTHEKASITLKSALSNFTKVDYLKDDSNVKITQTTDASSNTIRAVIHQIVGSSSSSDFVLLC